MDSTRTYLLSINKPKFLETYNRYQDKLTGSTNSLFTSSLSQGRITFGGWLALRWSPARIPLNCHCRLAISQAAKCYFPIVFLFATSSVANCNLCDFTVQPQRRNLQSAAIRAKPKVYLWVRVNFPAETSAGAVVVGLFCSQLLPRGIWVSVSLFKSVFLGVYFILYASVNHKFLICLIFILFKCIPLCAIILAKVNSFHYAIMHL